MDIEYDPAKNQQNLAIRGLSFELVRDFEINTALTWQDLRYDYGGEIRFISLGTIKNRLYALVFTPRGRKLRVISLRKANTREVEIYDKYSPP